MSCINAVNFSFFDLAHLRRHTFIGKVGGQPNLLNTGLINFTTKNVLMNMKKWSDTPTRIQLVVNCSA